MLMTLAFLPLSLAGVLAGFILFRLFDVITPDPARRLEDAPGGWGVMLDDAMAGVYGHMVMRLLAWALPGWMIA
jgi:phosphatidylglycerophosphatase A